MKADDFRKRCHRLAGLPPEYEGPILTPAQLNRNLYPDQERQFLIEVGAMAVHYFNQRKKFK